MRFFAEFILSLTTRFFAALRMTYEGLRMTNLHSKAIATQPLDRGIQNPSKRLDSRLGESPEVTRLRENDEIFTESYFIRRH